VRILIANKYYFMKGGAERLLFNTKAVLEAHGHEVVPFSIRFARNEPTPYARYFVDPPAGEGAVQLEQFRLRAPDLPRAVLSAFYSAQARRRIREAIRREGVDLVYMLNISNYVSASIVDGAHAEGVPVVHGLVDYHLVCPNATFNRAGKDRCLDCFPGKYWHGVVHRCVGRSLAASAMRAAVMFFDDATRIYHRVDAFVCLTPFMREVLARRGFERSKLHVALTPIDCAGFELGAHDDGTFLYVGRISREKGIDVLVEAAKLMRSWNSRVLVVGETSGRHARDCIARAAQGGGAPVEFLGPRYGDEMLGYLRRCRATVMPSRCIDNLPNALLESLAVGKPIVGSDNEGITVVVRDGENGLTFRSGDPADLAAKLDALAADADRARHMGLAGRRLVEAEHSPERHYESLMAAFEAARARRRATRQHGRLAH
jgi:glycosyltransferase involved in cell wall biosynthesis